MTPSDVATLTDLVEDDAGRSFAGERDPESQGPALGRDMDLHQLLEALQSMRQGDFSVRLPSHESGLAGRIADTFNDIVAANARMAQQLERVGEVVGREGKTKTRVRFGLSNGAWGDMEQSVNTLIDDLVWPTTQVTRTISAVAKGDLLQTMPLDVDGRPLKGEFLRSATIVNAHDRAAVGVHLRGDARGARGRHRRQARRPGPGGRGDRRVERPHRVGELDGLQPHRPGAQHRRGDHRRRQRRPLQEDHRRRARRDPAAQGSHQHHGGPAALVRLGSDARGSRSRHGRQAGRPGDRAGRRGRPGRTSPTR